MNATGTIFDIQRFSTHDGPGIRTTVFLKGCPLDCVWCHNPEGLSGETVVSYVAAECSTCGRCFEVCPSGAHQLLSSKHILDRAACEVCGACVRVCSSGALNYAGREVQVGDVMSEVLADKPFYESSGGGLTISGGEPTAQPEFTEALLALAKTERIHTCLDTSGYVDWSVLERLQPLVDLFLYDLKGMLAREHERDTGRGNSLIVENLRRLHDRGVRVRVRVPLVPGFNDSEDHLKGLVDLLRSLRRIDGVEVMPYHRLGSSKAVQIGTERPRAETIEPPDRETLRGWVNALRESGRKVLNEVD